jgi:hypothetical protein
MLWRMDHASIVSLLHGTRSPEEFTAEIASEVDACVQGFRTSGVGHIIVTPGPNTIIVRDHAGRFLRAILDARLPFCAANYLADALIMSDDFDFADPAVTDAIALVADDSRHPTDAEIHAALARLA